MANEPNPEDLGKQIRALLLDCRAALRKLDKHFQDSPLRHQLDTILVEMARSHWSKQALAGGAGGVPIAQRVAYAWQSVARELCREDHDHYHEMSEMVMQRLHTESLDDPADEIQDLRAELATLRAQAQQSREAFAVLHDALVQAVPLDNVFGCTDAELDQRRLQALLQALAQGGGLPKAATFATENSFMPDRAALEAVAAGERPFREGERDWCVGEALVITDFARTPEELQELEATALAKLVLDGPVEPPAAA